MKDKKIRVITEIGLISAIYMTISLVLAPLSYGMMQVRVAEALTIMPVFKKRYIYGITLGCFLTNFIGFFTGQNILGIFDSIFGTLATLLSGYLTYYLRNYKIKGLPILSTLPPIIINAIIIGMELTYVTTKGIFNNLFWINTLGVALGEIISCVIIGILLFLGMKSFIYNKK